MMTDEPAGLGMSLDDLVKKSQKPKYEKQKKKQGGGRGRRDYEDEERGGNGRGSVFNRLEGGTRKRAGPREYEGYAEEWQGSGYDWPAPRRGRGGGYRGAPEPVYAEREYYPSGPRDPWSAGEARHRGGGRGYGRGGTPYGSPAVHAAWEPGPRGGDWEEDGFGGRGGRGGRSGREGARGRGITAAVAPKADPKMEEAAELLRDCIMQEEETGDVLVSHTGEDVMRVKVSGEIVLKTGIAGMGQDTLQVVNAGLNVLGLKCSASPTDSTAWTVSDGKSLLRRFTEEMAIPPAAGQAGKGRGLALLQVCKHPSGQAAADATAASNAAAAAAGIEASGHGGRGRSRGGVRYAPY